VADRKAFPLRLNQDLYDELRRWAEQEFRSVNGQIEFLLREAVEKRGKARRLGETRGKGTEG
jgi:hypothetical protein